VKRDLLPLLPELRLYKTLRLGDMGWAGLLGDGACHAGTQTSVTGNGSST